MCGTPTPTNETSESGAAIQQPGLAELRDAVANHLWPKLRGLAALRRDVLAGLSSAVSNVPTEWRMECWSASTPSVAFTRR